jgi:hypothetical protein
MIHVPFKIVGDICSKYENLVSVSDDSLMMWVRIYVRILIVCCVSQTIYPKCYKLVFKECKEQVLEIFSLYLLHYYSTYHTRLWNRYLLQIALREIRMCSCRL